MKRIEYWLDTIQSRAPGVEVILIATECEEKTPHIPLDKIKSSYSNLIKSDEFFFPVGCENGKGVEELKKHIKDKAAKLDLVGERWPHSYAEAEGVLKNESTDKAYITRAELYKIFKDFNIDDDNHKNLSKFLGDTGLITHFPDSIKLNDFIVLKPQWLTRAISFVLENEELARNQGECNRQWLEEQWDNNYPGLFPKFYNCMKEFELLYQCEDDPNVNMIPLRFSYTKPDIPWSEIPDSSERRIRYEFNINPPAGIMSRFIVKIHHMIAKDIDNKGIYWHDGVFLRTGTDKFTSEALCEYNKDDRSLSFIVKAAYPQGLIEQLHGVLLAVLSFFKGLTPMRFYGCIKEENNKQCPGNHPERRIKYALSKKSKIDCEYGYHLVDPLFLVTGLSSFAQSTSLDKTLIKMFEDQWRKQPAWAEAFGADLKSLLWRSEKNILKRLDENIDEISASNYQMCQQILREFLNGINILLDERDFTPIPSVFSIIPTNVSAWNPKQYFEHKYTLVPYCESDDCVHPIDFAIEFNRPRIWWQKTAPIIAVVVKILTISMKIGLAWHPPNLDLIENDMSNKLVEKDINLMKELLNAIPDLNRDINSELDTSLGDEFDSAQFDNRITIHDLSDHDNRVARMQMAIMLKEINPENYGAIKWGELERVRYPDNTYRWLCDKHRKEFHIKYSGD